jgi:hypothetical protein
MSTVEIALSADQDADLVFLEKIFWTLGVNVILRHEEPIDLLLRERISWFDRRRAPDIIICSYRNFFTDLKVIADLKRFPAYQWVTVITIVNEDISRVRHKFLEFGISGVLEWKAGTGAIRRAVVDLTRGVFEPFVR